MHDLIKKFPEGIVLKLQKVKMIIVVMEGVLTSSTLLYTSKHPSYTFNLLDDTIVKPLREKGIIVVAIAHKASDILKQKADELAYDDYKIANEQSHDLMKAFCDEFELSVDEICFIGFDLPDLSLLKRSGLGICPANSVDYIQAHAAFCTKAKGGEGVLREVSDLILASQNKLDNIVSEHLKQ